MSSFPAQAARVRDASLPMRRRLLALRECVLHFAPYGFRATWHHLVITAGLPVWLENDTDSLLRAIDELEEARRVWLAEATAYTTRRTQEKAAGRRHPHRDDGWHNWAQWLAFCPNPQLHPQERLSTVVHRLLDTYRSGATSAQLCPACQAARPGLLCPNCGVYSWSPTAYPWNPVGLRPSEASDTGLPWQLIWHRVVPRETTVGGGDIGQCRVEFTPTSQDARFGIFQIYLRGVPIGDATTTALYPHLQDLQRLCDAAELPGSQGPQPLILGDTFDHLDMTLEVTEQDLIFAFATSPQWGTPPPWAPRKGIRMRLLVRRAEFVKACQQAQPQFRQLLNRR